MLGDAWKALQGHSIQIERLTLTSNRGVHLSILCKTEKDYWRIDFENVSALHIREFNFPMMIYGFEIRDNLYRGWEHDNRYTIRDFEEGQISFHCQDIRAYITDSITR